MKTEPVPCSLLTPKRVGGLLILSSLFLAFCGEPAADGPHGKLAPLQPNAHSELAKAMRQLDGELVALLAEQAPSGIWDGATLSRLPLAELAPTDSTMLVPGFQGFAMAFDQHVAAFNEAPSEATYQAVVNGCLSCHQRACPGPVSRIKKRRLASN